MTREQLRENLLRELDGVGGFRASRQNQDRAAFNNLRVGGGRVELAVDVRLFGERITPAIEFFYSNPWRRN